MHTTYPRLFQTGHSKHFGYIEFDSSSVAQIVADTMDNYLLMGHILRCKLIPKDQVHPELWVGANRKWRIVPSSRLALAEHNKVLVHRKALLSTVYSLILFCNSIAPNGRRARKGCKEAHQTSEPEEEKARRGWYQIRFRCCRICKCLFQTLAHETQTDICLMRFPEKAQDSCC